MSKPIRLISIPQYPDKVLIANARRPKYYKKGDKIPPSFLKKDWYVFNEKGILINLRTNQPQLANPGTAGKPRYWVVNFQDIWNGNMARQSRASRVDKLKEILRPYVARIKPIKVFPIEVSLHIYDVSMPVDISNKGVIYTKVIEDLMVEQGVIPNDTVQYINCSGRVRYIEVKDPKDKCLHIAIYKSEYL